MKRFEMSFKNPIVRIWSYIVLPMIVISIFLFIILPVEYHNVIAISESLIFIIFIIWMLTYKNNSSN
jgi:hypothetical protein